MRLVWSVCVLLTARLVCASDFMREVTLELNPGLTPGTPLPSNVNASLLHARALGRNDTLHLLFSSLGAPALLLVHSNSTESAVRVNWTAFLNGQLGGVQVVPGSSVQYSSALVFTRLWEYDDVNNTADPQDLPPSSFLPPYELKDFTWDELNKTVNYTHHTAQLCGRDHSAAFANASFCLDFAAFGSVGRGEVWPSLLHNANSSQLRMSLQNLTPRSNASRFALELQTVSELGFQGRVDVKESIDDEYTPSIFQVSQWVSTPDNSTTVWGYTQWKPVAYRKAVPVLEDATPCRHSEPILLTLPQTSPSGLVGSYFPKKSITHGINISFSIAGDPFYTSTHFLSWTLLFGMGTPPADFFSPMVIAVVAVGLGTPLLLILVGGVYLCIRKRMQDQDGYRPIN